MRPSSCRINITAKEFLLFLSLITVANNNQQRAFFKKSSNVVFVFAN